MVGHKKIQECVIYRSVNLTINSHLCEPPSSISCFRDVTLYASVYIFEDILLSCKKGTRSSYWKWLKDHGAHDFISYLILEGEEEGFTIGLVNCNLNIDRINYFNLNYIIQRLSSLK